MTLSLDVIAGRACHPATRCIPLMEDDRLDELVESIREHGQLDPIVEHAGQILDGRNRLLACERLGIAPLVRPWELQGGTPVTFISIRNLRRRDLTDQQRVFAAAEMIEHLEREAHARKVGNLKRGATFPDSASPALTGRAAAQAAAAAGLKTRTVEKARRVLRAAPELVPEVKSGKVSMAKADAVAREREARKDSPVVARVKRAAEKRRAKAADLVDRAREDARRTWSALVTRYQDEQAHTALVDEMAALVASERAKTEAA